MNRVLSLAAGALLSLSLLGGSAVPLAAQTPDWSVPNGHFFTQAGAGTGGFTIADDDGLRFWSAFQQLGGAQALGYPASRRFTRDGFTYQLTQAAMLQHHPVQGGVTLGNTFELLQEAGRDGWLRDTRGIPLPISNDGSTSFAEAAQIRLGWLSEPAIRERYLQHPNPASGREWTERDAMDLYGLPMSRPERMGPFIAQRFQRVAFQLWVQQVPGLPAPGTVTAVLGGDLLKEAGLVDGPAATPHGAGAVVNRPVALGTTLVAPTATAAAAATATPRPAATATVRPATARPSGPVQTLDTSLSEYSIYVPQITVKPGTVRFSLTNVGVQRHNVRVVGNGIDRKSVDLIGGRSAQLEVTFVDAGPYYVYCDISDHEQLGMALTLNVSE
jgi:plastocyanin